MKTQVITPMMLGIGITCILAYVWIRSRTHPEGFRAAEMVHSHNFLREKSTVTDVPFESANTPIMGTPPQDRSALDALVQDTYPLTEHAHENLTSANSTDQIWWHYPTFKLGSYEQVTNNIQFPDNPDVGRCTPPEMCGALYKEKRTGPNTILPIPCPVDGVGVRVNFFNAE